MHSELFHGSHTVWCKSATMLSNVHLRQVASAFRNYLSAVHTSAVLDRLPTLPPEWVRLQQQPTCSQEIGRVCVMRLSINKKEKMASNAVSFSRHSETGNHLRPIVDLAANCWNWEVGRKLESTKSSAPSAPRLGMIKPRTLQKSQQNLKMLSCCWFQLFEAFDWLYQT